MKSQPANELLTTAQVAVELSVTTRTVLNYIEAGHFPNAQKLQGATTTYLIPRNDLLAFQEKRRQTGNG